jgi:hypothetical protein
MEKLNKARMHIKKNKQKKKGYNKYSEYPYFEPEQIEEMVSNACQMFNLFTKFDLKRNELGLTGYLTVIDLETKETLIFEMASAIPNITATNETQKLGGCVTYTERYLQMTAFSIKDNSLDLDSHKTTPKASQNVKKEQEDNKKWLNDVENGVETKEWINVLDGIQKGKIKSVAEVRMHYKVSKSIEEKLNKIL